MTPTEKLRMRQFSLGLAAVGLYVAATVGEIVALSLSKDHSYGAGISLALGELSKFVSLGLVARYAFALGAYSALDNKA